MPARPASPGRPAFWLLAALLVVAGVEAGARIIERIDNAAARRKNPYVEAVNPVPAFEVFEQDGRKMVRRTGFHPLMVDSPPFPLERPPGGLRAFILGASAAAGWPYQRDETNIGALLRAKLQKLYPGRAIEVVNAAAGTYASHRVRIVLEEVLRYNPDLLFVYNGNNEFLENLVFTPRTPPAPWRHSAAARLAYRGVTALTARPARFDVKNYGFEDQLQNHLSFAFAQPSRYRDDPGQFELLLENYRLNLEGMIASAAEAKVPLFLVTCPVNLKDWSPNVSRHRKDLDADGKARWQLAFREGYLAAERGEHAAAIGPLQRSIELDDAYAEGHFLLGEALLATGRPVEAKAAFVRALERDAFPFRETPEFQAVLREVASARGAPLVDIVPVIEQASRDGIPGLDVLIDYVHLTQESQELVAQEMIRVLLARGFLPGVGAADVERARITIPESFVPGREVFAADVTYSLAMLQQQHRRLQPLYRRMVEVFERAAREEPELERPCRARLAFYARVQEAALAYAKLVRAEKLGLAQQGYTPAQAEWIVRQYEEMISRQSAESLSRDEFQRVISGFRRRE